MSFFPWTIEDYMERIEKDFNLTPRKIAIISAFQGVLWLLVVILSIISSIVS
jgi:hypothetical protein